MLAVLSQLGRMRMFFSLVASAVICLLWISSVQAAKPGPTYIIDTGNSLAANLVFATVLNQGTGSPTDLVTGASATPVGSAAWTTMTNGDPGRVYLNNGDGDYFSTFDSTGATAAMTIVVVSESTDGVKSGGALASKADANAGLYDFMVRRSGGNDNFQLFFGAGNSQDSGISATNKTFYGVAADATSVFWNVDGTTATGAGITTVSEAKRLVVGARYLNPTYDSPTGAGVSGGKVSAVFWWSRKLSAAELVTLQGNPWAFLIAPTSTKLQTKNSNGKLFSITSGTGKLQVK